MAKEKDQDKTEEKQKHNSSLANGNSNQNGNISDPATKLSQQKKQITSKFWRKFWYETDTSTKANVVMAICNIIALIIIFIMSSNQNELSRQSLLRADTSNSYTRRSIETQERALRDLNRKNIADSIAERIKDSIFTKSQYRRDSLNHESFILENRAYIEIGAIIEHTNKSLRIEIENRGRITSKKIFTDFQYFLSNLKSTPAITILNKSVKSEAKCEIAPGGNLHNAIYISLPILSDDQSTALNSGYYTTTIGGRIKYDAGFGRFDSLDICLVRQNNTSKWTRCGLGTVDIDFNAKGENEKNKHP